MESLQSENGHVDIANGIVEALCRVQLSGYESRILWALFRKTYGWHKKEDRISLSQFQELTGLPIPKISTTLSRLAMRKMIRVTENGNNKVKTYGFQKVFSIWRELPEKVTPKKLHTDEGAGEGSETLGVTDFSNPQGVSHGLCNKKDCEKGLPKKVLPKTGIPENGNSQKRDEGLPISASTKETITKEITTDDDNSARRPPLDHIRDLFNRCCPSFPPVLDLSSPARWLAVSSIWAKHAGCQGGQLSFLEDLFARAEASDRLTNRDGQWQGRPCMIDWILDPDNYVRLLEGVYDNGKCGTRSFVRSSNRGGPGASAAAAAKLGTCLDDEFCSRSPADPV